MKERKKMKRTKTQMKQSKFISNRKYKTDGKISLTRKREGRSAYLGSRWFEEDRER